MIDLNVFKRIDVHLAGAMVAVNSLGGSILWAYGDAMTGETHEPLIQLFVSLAIVVCGLLTGVLALVKAWVKRNQPRPHLSEHHSLTSEITRLYRETLQNTRDIQDIRGNVARIEEKLDRSQAALVAVIRQEFAAQAQLVGERLNEVSSFVTIAREHLARLAGDEAPEPKADSRPSRRRGDRP